MQNADYSASARTRAIKGRALAVTHGRDVATPPSQSADRSAGAYVNLAYGADCCGPTGPVDPQGTPNITNIIDGNGQLTVEFELIETPRSLDRALPTYTVTATPVAGVAKSASGPASPITVTDLSNGVPYTVKVTYVTSTGVTTESGTELGTPATVPGAPTISFVVPQNATTLRVFFAANNNGGSNVTNFAYELRPAGGSYGNPVIIPVQSNQYDITGLTTGVTYTIRMYAINAKGQSLPSTPATGTPSAQPVVQSFTTVGTTSWTVPAGVTSVEYLSVGGGGGGGGGWDTGGGGGGGGGMVLQNTLAVTPGAIASIVVGAGGDGGTSSGTNWPPSSAPADRTASNGSDGSSSSVVVNATTITALGGGKGYIPGSNPSGGSLGSGGAGSTNSTASTGGDGGQRPGGGGGGGGYTTTGTNGTLGATTTKANGGAGITSTLLAGTFGSGGLGGYGTNSGTGNEPGAAGAANTGAGGGGASVKVGNHAAGGNGGSGIVVLKYTV